MSLRVLRNAFWRIDSVELVPQTFQWKGEGISVLSWHQSPNT